MPARLRQIRRLAPRFLETLGSIIGIEGERAIDIISRKGRVLTARQVRALLAWLNKAENIGMNRPRSYAINGMVTRLAECQEASRMAGRI
jgi:hypothetical protein